MIKSFKYKGLKKFFETGSVAGIQASHTNKLSDRLAMLNSSNDIEDMNLPDYRLHPLVGKQKGRWAVDVSGNWRVTFEFIDGDAYIIDYEDYH